MCMCYYMGVVVGGGKEGGVHALRPRQKDNVRCPIALPKLAALMESPWDNVHSNILLKLVKPTPDS